MHTMVRFLTALRLRTDQETLEEFAIHALRCLFDKEEVQNKSYTWNYGCWLWRWQLAIADSDAPFNASTSQRINL